MRTIKVKLTTQANLVSIETAATYLGEFKNEPAVKDLGINWDASKLIDKGSKNTLELDETLLPAGDAIFFVFPTKTNSGVDYSTMKFGELRKVCAAKLPKGTISANPTRDEMLRALTNTQPVKKETAPVKANDVILYEIITSETLANEYKTLASKLRK